MISVLLLPLLLEVAPALATAPQDDPPIRLWINNDRRFLPSDRAKVEVRTQDDGYLLVFHVDPEGHLRVLFPLDPDGDNFVRGGKKYEIKGRGGRESFEVDNSTGKGTVYAAVSRDAFRFDEFVVGDHWDYRVLAPSRLPDEPEQELNELVRRMAQGDFDYDLLNYYVYDRVAYRSSDYYYPNYGSHYDPFGCYYSCASYYGSPFNVSIGLFFGRPYRRYYYDPYFYAYDPFFNPFFYDPYYYAPVYRPRYVFPYSRYYVYDRYYHDRYYYDRYRPYRQPYTPYRFRGGDGSLVGYRNRLGPTRWVNTVYNRPISPIREPAVVSPARRLTSPRSEASPPATADRARRVISENRGELQRVEARPARDREQRANDREPRLVRREVIANPPEQRDQPRARRSPVEDRGSDRMTEGPDRSAEPRVREAPRARQPAADPRSQPERRVERSSPPSKDRGGARDGNEGRRRP